MNSSYEKDKRKIREAALEQAKHKQAEAEEKNDARLFDQAADFYELAERPHAAAVCRNQADRIRGNE